MKKLNDLEKELLELLYQRDYDDNFELNVSIDSFRLTESNKDLKTKEISYYILKLKDLGFIELGNRPKALSRAGGDDNKYRNNVIMIWWESVKLSYKGRHYVEEARITQFEKFKRSIVNFFCDIGLEIRGKVVSHLATFILGIIVTLIYVKFTR